MCIVRPVHVHIHIYICKMKMYVYIYVYVYTYIYIYMYIYTHITFFIFAITWCRWCGVGIAGMLSLCMFQGQYLNSTMTISYKHQHRDPILESVYRNTRTSTEGASSRDRTEEQKTLTWSCRVEQKRPMSAVLHSFMNSALLGGQCQVLIGPVCEVVTVDITARLQITLLASTPGPPSRLAWLAWQSWVKISARGC